MGTRNRNAAKVPSPFLPWYVTNFKDEILIRRGECKDPAKTTARMTSYRQHNGRVRVVSDPNCYLFYLNNCHIYLNHDFTRICMRRYIDQLQSNAKEIEKTHDQPKTTMHPSVP